MVRGSVGTQWKLVRCAGEKFGSDRQGAQKATEQKFLERLTRVVRGTQRFDIFLEDLFGLGSPESGS